MKKPNNRTLQNLQMQNENISAGKEVNILALDYGEKFCGFAFSPDGICVFPLEIVESQGLYKKIIELLNKKCVQILIVGLPLQNNNTENETCSLIRSEIEKLELSIPIQFVDERGSSKASESPTKEGRHDDLAAAKILEFYLAQKHTPPL